MRVGSLFSGIGGLDLAIHGTPAWFCEADPAAQQVLQERFPGIPIVDDVRRLVVKLTEDDKVEAVRMYEDGSSCQTIAERYGVSRQAMWDVLRRRTTMRPRERMGADNIFYRGGAKASSRAHDIMEKAIARGELTRPDRCDECGSIPPPARDGRSMIQGHHDDYNHPLSVRWLCQPCHHEWHRLHQPVEEVVSAEVPEYVDMLTGGFP